MGRKNRNKNKKKKESDGSDGNVNGGSSSSNSNSNDITIPTVATTTTQIILTTKEIGRIDIRYGLKGYPKSSDFLIGYGHYRAHQPDLAITSFKRGVENDGCVPCMFFYVDIQWKRGNVHLVIPYALEGAIRGHLHLTKLLIDCYQKTKPVMAHALASLWAKMGCELGNTQSTEEENHRKEIKKRNANSCYVCRVKDLEDNDVTLVKCGICKYYSYCGKNCQSYA